MARFRWGRRDGTGLRRRHQIPADTEYESGIVQNLFGVIANAKAYYTMAFVYNGEPMRTVVANAIGFLRGGSKGSDD